MFELSVRIIFGAVLMAVSGVTGHPPFESSLQVSILVASYGVFAYLLERRGLRNPTTNTILAVADCAALASVSAMAGLTSSLGIVVLIPCAYAVHQWRVSGFVLAPIAAALIVAASNVFSEGGFTPQILAQAILVAVIGCLISPRKFSQIPPPVSISPLQTPEEDVRESYRKLRDEFRTMERQTRQDRIAVAVFEAIHQIGGTINERLAARMRQIAGVESASIYISNTIGTTLYAEATSGMSDTSESASIDLQDAVSDALRKDRVYAAIKSESSLRHATIFLKHGANLVGMVLLQDESQAALDEGERRVADAAPFVAAAIAERQQGEAQARRLREAELLYMVAATARGAETKSSLVTRVVREMQDLLGLEFAAVSLLEAGEEIPVLSQRGIREFIESMSFAYGSGLAGWSKTGAHEVWVPDASADDRVDREHSLKSRISSLAILPLRVEGQPSGVVIVAGKRAGAIDEAMLECLRVVTAELAHALHTLNSSTELPQGLATPAEFHAAIPHRQKGAIIYIEPIRTDRLVDTFGRPAVMHANRQFAHRLRTLLPAGSLICRRPEGDFVAHVPGNADEVAACANEITAQAALIGIRTPDGKSRMPFAIRARVAELSPQNYQILQESAA